MIINPEDRSEIPIDKHMYWVFRGALQNIRDYVHISIWGDEVKNYFIHITYRRDRGEQLFEGLKTVIYFVPIIVVKSPEFNIGGSGLFNIVKLHVFAPYGRELSVELPVVIINFGVYKFIEDFIKNSSIKNYPPGKFTALLSLFNDVKGLNLMDDLYKLVEQGQEIELSDWIFMLKLCFALEELLIHELGHALEYYVLGKEFADCEMIPLGLEYLLRRFYDKKFSLAFGILGYQRCVDAYRFGKKWIYETLCIDTVEELRSLLSHDVIIEKFEDLSDAYPQISIEEFFEKFVQGVEEGKIWIFGFPEHYRRECDLITFDRAVMNWIKLRYSSAFDRYLSDKYIKQIEVKLLEKGDFERLMKLREYKILRSAFVKDKLSIYITGIEKIEKESWRRRRKRGLT